MPNRIGHSTVVVVDFSFCEEEYVFLIDWMCTYVLE